MMKKIVNKKRKTFIKIFCDAICLILCISQVIFLFSPTILAASSNLRNSKYGVDPDTTDDYINRLINETNGSRYAGRIWSDKSVFRESITLDNDTDGYKGTITNNSDFLHVFSVLGSSQRINSYSNTPIDAIFLLDMSGSMAIDLHASENGHTHSKDNSAKEHLEHSRMKKVLDSMNNAINTLMELNETNRVAVIAYGGTAEVLMPLAHYKKANGNNDYLTVSDLTDYENATPKETGSGAYTVTANAQKANEKNNSTYETYTKSVRNNYPANKSKEKLSNAPNETIYIGYQTDMQAGIYVGFEELYNNLVDTDDVTYKYKSGTNEVTVPRIPVAFVMTDGGSNYALKSKDTEPNTGDEWYNLPKIKLEDNDNYTGNHEKYRSEMDVDSNGGDAVILDILLTASYMKSKVQNKYTKLLQQANILKDNEKANMKIHTISIDTPEYNWQPPRVYATLNPIKYFNAQGDSSFNITNNNKTKEFNKDITSAYQSFLKWKENDITIEFCDNEGRNNNSPYNCKNGNNRTIKFNRLKDAENAEVTNQDVINNINYNDDFFDISATNLEETFKNIITNINGDAFTPVGGTNEYGSNDSLTYTDPIGEYMEIKNDSITLEGNKTYDMSLLLFGTMYGIEKAAIYDSTFNQKHLNSNNKFVSGWYDSNGTKKETGSWSNGDTYYLSDEDVKDYITDDNAINNKNKKIIIYRIAETDTELEKVQANKSYGDINQVYYKLKDIKIIIDIDENGKQNLYFNLPTTALPLQTVTIQMDRNNENVESYKTNLEDKKLSTPLRLFYEVGLVDSIKMNDGKDIDLDKIDKEYLKKHISEDDYLNFFSNYYSESTYDGYIADIQDDARTKGDAFLTLSPSINNRYYIFQKNLKLYSHAYIIGDNGQVKEVSDPLNFDGANFDGVYKGQTENNQPNSTAQTAIKNAFNNQELKKGDIIVLEEDVVKYGTNPSSDAFYYFAIDYFMPASNGTGKEVQYVVARKGSEFGSGIVEHEGTKLPKGDFLSWIDESGKNSKTYGFEEEIPKDIESKGNWVLATKIGGLRIGDLHQSILKKENNITNTSKSYYLPIIADDPSTIGSDAILNAYLGNNGLLTYRLDELAIPDTGGKGIAIIIIFGSLFIIESITLIIKKYHKKKEV